LDRPPAPDAGPRRERDRRGRRHDRRHRAFELDRRHTLRDLTVDAAGEEHERRIVDAVRAVEGAEVVDWTDRTLGMHVGGKLELRLRHPPRSADDLSMAYTPGVARVCDAIAADPDKAFQYTIKRNTVAVVSDGTAVLGLGDIGPAAAMPVMEGEAMLFKEFAGRRYERVPCLIEPEYLNTTSDRYKVASAGVTVAPHEPFRRPRRAARQRVPARNDRHRRRRAAGPPPARS
jgi:Malic enzyme, N-terminal domain